MNTATKASMPVDIKFMKNTPNKKEAVKAILFDMDGVLVDVTNSYRKAIQETVGVFTGKKAILKEIQDLKQQGGYNNDWDLTETIINSRGKTPSKKEIIEKFQQFYLGCEGKKGLIENEKWLLSVELLEKLRSKYILGIVTGRPRQEAHYILEKYQVKSFFNVVIAMEDYPAEKAKPDPLPIEIALNKLGNPQAIYVGDSVDDIIAAKRACVKPVGCIPPNTDIHKLKNLLQMQGAEIILDNINDLNHILLL